MASRPKFPLRREEAWCSFRAPGQTLESAADEHDDRSNSGEDQSRERQRRRENQKGGSVPPDWGRDAGKEDRIEGALDRIKNPAEKLNLCPIQRDQRHHRQNEGQDQDDEAPRAPDRNGPCQWIIIRHLWAAMGHDAASIVLRSPKFRLDQSIRCRARQVRLRKLVAIFL